MMKRLAVFIGVAALGAGTLLPYATLAKPAKILESPSIEAFEPATVRFKPGRNCSAMWRKVYANELFGPTECCNPNASIKPTIYEVDGMCISTMDGSLGTCVLGWDETCGDGICLKEDGEDKCNCPADCALQCVPEGESTVALPDAPPCCGGFAKISPAYLSQTGECISAVGSVICSDCGNGICEEWENECNCEEDCGTSQQCVPAGGTTPVIPDAPECCKGLEKISVATHIESIDGNTEDKCIFAVGSVICSDCGNGTCEEWENECNCEEDCPESAPICGNGICEEGEGPVCSTLPNETCQKGSCMEDCKVILNPPIYPPNEPGCGDGEINDDEECDDGNEVDGDGCSILCEIEEGAHCATYIGINGERELCATCGDGVCEAGEGCTSSHCDMNMCTNDCGGLYCPQDCPPLDDLQLPHDTELPPPFKEQEEDNQQKQCIVAGCSGQMCVEEGSQGASNCYWTPAYACYARASCEQQANGECGWTQTDKLKSCLENGGETELLLTPIRGNNNGRNCAAMRRKVYFSPKFGPTECCNPNASIKPIASEENGMCIAPNDGSIGTCVMGWDETCGDGICDEDEEDKCNCRADCAPPQPPTYREACWQCYGDDAYGEAYRECEGSTTSCYNAEYFKERAEIQCEGHCDEETGKCGVNIFELRSQCMEPVCGNGICEEGEGPTCWTDEVCPPGEFRCIVNNYCEMGSCPEDCSVERELKPDVKIR